MVLEEWQPEAPGCTSSHSPIKSHAPLQLAQRADRVGLDVGGGVGQGGLRDSLIPWRLVQLPPQAAPHDSDRVRVAAPQLRDQPVHPP